MKSNQEILKEIQIEAELRASKQEKITEEMRTYTPEERKKLADKERREARWVIASFLFYWLSFACLIAGVKAYRHPYLHEPNAVLMYAGLMGMFLLFGRLARNHATIVGQEARRELARLIERKGRPWFRGW